MTTDVDRWLKLACRKSYHLAEPAELAEALREAAERCRVLEKLEWKYEALIAGEVLRLQLALGVANERAMRWEDKVHAYGREVDALRERAEKAEERIRELETQLAIRGQAFD